MASDDREEEMIPENTTQAPIFENSFDEVVSTQMKVGKLSEQERNFFV